MSLDDVDVSWARVGGDAALVVAALQVTGAREAVSYVPRVLDEQGMDAPAVATVQPLAFARGSSGLPLPDVLATVPAAVKRSVGAAGREGALRSGLALLEGIAETHIADACRLASAAEMTARPAVQTWTRVLNLPSCGRCAVLAGKVFRWNASFARHPRCDCRALPSTVVSPGAQVFDPRRYFDDLSPIDQDRRFGKAVAARIRDGDDLVKSVNASRDAWRVRLAGERRPAKTAGGITGQVQAQTFMESLTQDVADRAQAIRNLADAGYLAA